MNGQAKLETTALVIGIMVIFVMILAFLLLFIHYAKQRRKVIDRGIDDPEVDKELGQIRSKAQQKANRKALASSNPESLYDTSDEAVLESLLSLHGDSYSAEAVTYVDSFTQNRKKRKALTVIGDIVYGVFVLILLVLAAFGILCASCNDGVTFIGDKAILVVVTGSMEKKNPARQDLDGYDNQIEQFSMITLCRTDITAVEKGDVIAFYDHENNVIVHRVVSVNDDCTLTTMGDANTTSNPSYEFSIGEDRLIGIWTGYQSFGLGITVTYLRSTLGMVALFGTGVFLLIYCVAEDSLERTWVRRLEARASYLDESKVSGEDDPSKVSPEETSFRRDRAERLEDTRRDVRQFHERK